MNENPLIEALFVFSLVWSIGVMVKKSGRKQLHDFMVKEVSEYPMEKERKTYFAAGLE